MRKIGPSRHHRGVLECGSSSLSSRLPFRSRKRARSSAIVSARRCFYRRPPRRGPLLAVSAQVCCCSGRLMMLTSQKGPVSREIHLRFLRKPRDDVVKNLGRCAVNIVARNDVATCASREDRNSVETCERSGELASCFLIPFPLFLPPVQSSFVPEQICSSQSGSNAIRAPASL